MDTVAEHDRSKRSTHRNSLSQYLDRAGSFDLLDADTEREMARELVQLRRDRWRAVMSCPSVLDGLLVHANEVLGKRMPVNQARSLKALLAKYRDEPTAARAQRLGEGVEAFISALMESDPEGTWAEAVHAGVLAQREGKESDLTKVWAKVSSPAALERCFARVDETHTAYVRARNRFVCANLRLVVKVAQRYGRNRMSLADRVQEGNFGLLKAAERFDPERGVRFSTYAAWWIRHSVTRALVNRGRTVRIPAHLHAIFTKAMRARQAMRGELGREPTLAELARRIDTPQGKVALAIDAMELRSVGFDAPTAGDGTPSIADSLEDEQPEELTLRLDAHFDLGLVRAALTELEDMEADIVAQRFGLRGGKRATLQALGDKYRLSRERIRQLQNRALRKLKEAMDGSDVPSLALVN